MHPDLCKKTKIIVMGNPGSGKSTTQNLFAQCAVFECGPGSSMNAGGGLTQEWSVWPDPVKNKDQFESHPWVLVDSPGLGDLITAKQCADTLTESLKQEGPYILLFVIRADGVRIQGDDIRMITTVLESLGSQVNENEYCILVNKVSQSWPGWKDPEKKRPAHREHPEFHQGQDQSHLL